MVVILLQGKDWDPVLRNLHGEKIKVLSQSCLSIYSGYFQSENLGPKAFRRANLFPQQTHRDLPPLSGRHCHHQNLVKDLNQVVDSQIGRSVVGIIE